MILGFLVICSGVILLQMSKSAKDVPDAAIFAGDLDQMRTIAEQEQPESEPKADTFRGTAGLIRAMSKSRRRMEHEEAKRLHEEKQKDLEPIGEDEVVEWDGLRRRRTTIGSRSTGSVRRQKTVHPPLGMSQMPDHDDEHEHRPTSSSAGGAFGFGFRRGKSRRVAGTHGIAEELGEGSVPNSPHSPVLHHDGSVQMGHVYGLPEDLKAMPQQDGSSRRPLQWANDVESQPSISGSKSPNLAPPSASKRTFSFQNVFHRKREEEEPLRSPLSQASNKSFDKPRVKNETSEEERLGLVKGDSHLQMPIHDDISDKSDFSDEPSQLPPLSPYDDYDSARQRHAQTAAAPRGHPLPQTPEFDEDDDRMYHEAQRQKPQGGPGPSSAYGGSRYL